MTFDFKQCARREPLYDINPQTGVSIEVFYADRALESFGRRGTGWFWWARAASRQRARDWPLCYQLRSISPRLGDRFGG